jgi:hypothetical protein
MHICRDLDDPDAAIHQADAGVPAADAQNAMRALIPVLGTDSGAPERVRLQAWLVDAQLGYHRGDRARPATAGQQARE